MSGDVNPLEWIVPPIAIAHETISAASTTAGVPKGTLAAPGSPNADRYRPTITPLGTPIVPRPRVQPGPQSAQEEERARRRAVEARSRLGPSTRASDQLTSTLG